MYKCRRLTFPHSPIVQATAAAVAEAEAEAAVTVYSLSDMLAKLGLEDYISDFEKAGRSTIDSVAQLSDEERQALCADMSKKERNKFLEWASGLALVPSLLDALTQLGLEEYLSAFENAGHLTTKSVAQLSDDARQKLCADMSKREREKFLDWARKPS